MGLTPTQIKKGMDVWDRSGKNKPFSLTDGLQLLSMLLFHRLPPRGRCLG